MRENKQFFGGQSQRLGQSIDQRNRRSAVTVLNICDVACLDADGRGESRTESFSPRHPAFFTTEPSVVFGHPQSPFMLFAGEMFINDLLMQITETRSGLPCRL
jgi:hypothetical protein